MIRRGVLSIAFGVRALLPWALFSVACYGEAQTVLYVDDFEGSVTGWSNNMTDFDPGTTRILGRFDNSPMETSRTFTIPANTDRVEIEFDFYRVDSWDNSARFGFDRFEIDIDGTEIFSLEFLSANTSRSGTTGNVDWAHLPTILRSQFAFNQAEPYWHDERHRVTIIVNNPGPTTSITLRTDVSQGGNDEAGGYDNFLVTAFPLVAPELSLQKDVAVVDVLGVGDFAVPGNQVEYTFTLESTGTAIDANTISIKDALPGDLTLFTGDLDGAGQPVVFQDLTTPASGLNCCGGAEVLYADETTGTPVFDYVPTTPFDPAVTHIQIIPSGTLRDSTVDVSTVTFKLRARID